MECENRGGEKIHDSRERTEIRNSRDRSEIQNSKERTEIRNSRDRAELQNSKDGAELRNSGENSGTGAQLPKQTILYLIQEATEAMGKAYVPYSHFRVGAALLTKEGKIYQGCNIENAAYTPTNCAERTAFFKAVSEGERNFQAICIVGGMDGVLTGYTTPCGVCRQVMREFCDPENFQIILAKSDIEYCLYTLKELLPEGFGPENLGKDSSV